ncbi:hypothetical protein PN499_05490 [Kamptonema animale CS-326]|jgi:hypothetical protein|uniref:hypothetical protein n=1 Tax=Kamptonema animale TaxID=92934 RepID=UPI00232D7910|nr:hypothetical protein [Kamptonema animale]MDB9510629.1 hypothetical protein [Kamptonema animale CS-326]
MATIRDVQGDPSSAWDDLSWTDMNSAEQKLWAVLGWDEDSWEEETDPPESNDRYWEDLTDAEKNAALELGYTQELWDEE